MCDFTLVADWSVRLHKQCQQDMLKVQLRRGLGIQSPCPQHYTLSYTRCACIILQYPPKQRLRQAYSGFDRALLPLCRTLPFFVRILVTLPWVGPLFLLKCGIAWLFLVRLGYFFMHVSESKLVSLSLLEKVACQRQSYHWITCWWWCRLWAGTRLLLFFITNMVLVELQYSCAFHVIKLPQEFACKDLFKSYLNLRNHFWRKKTSQIPSQLVTLATVVLHENNQPLEQTMFCCCFLTEPAGPLGG